MCWCASRQQHTLRGAAPKVSSPPQSAARSILSCARHGHDRLVARHEQDHVFIIVPIPNQGGDGYVESSQLPYGAMIPMPRGWMLPQPSLLDAVASRSTAEARSWVHAMPFCERCNATACFKLQSIFWAKFEGWRGLVQLLDETIYGPSKYDYVLFTEADSHFQSDPFRIPLRRRHKQDPGEIWVSTSPYTYVATDVVGRWMNGFNSSCCFEQLKERSVPHINPGVFLATHRAMRDLLHKTIEHWIAHPAVHTAATSPQ
jgi:hypothetical protein